MAKALTTILFIICALSLPISSFSADEVKITYKATIYFDAKGNGLKLPEGVAFAGRTVLIVADTGNGRLLRYTVDDSSIKGGDEVKVAEVTNPLRVQVNSRGEIFVLDGKRRKIVRLSTEGVFKGYLEPAGAPSPAEFVPRSFKIDKTDNIYILDIFSERVIVLDSSGKYVRHIEFPKKYGFFSDLAVDSRGTIFLLDAVDALVYSANSNAKDFAQLSKALGEYLNFPTNMVVDSRGIMYLSDQNGSGMVILGPDGSFMGRPIAFGWKDGLVRYPAQLSLSEKGDLCIADRENSRVQIFDTQ